MKPALSHVSYKRFFQYHLTLRCLVLLAEILISMSGMGHRHLYFKKYLMGDSYDESTVWMIILETCSGLSFSSKTFAGCLPLEWGCLALNVLAIGNWPPKTEQNSFIQQKLFEYKISCKNSESKKDVPLALCLTPYSLWKPAFY